MAHPSTIATLGALVAVGVWFGLRWWVLEKRRASLPSIASAHAPTPENPGLGAAPPRRPHVIDLVIGFVTNFFDTLGIGSFAPTTAAFKLLRRVPDEQIPGTLNVGHALPTVAEGLIFIAAVTVAPVTLIGMISAAVAGAWLGVGFVSRLPRRTIQIAMGVALLIAATLFLAGMLHWMPTGGEAIGLQGAKLAVAIGVSFLLGALMMLGIGLYAPCLILVSLLGMNPLAAFPIMMGSCAFLMPVGGARFVATGRYSLRASLGLTIGGIPGVLIAAFIVKSMPIDALRWLVVVVVTYTAVTMLLSARRSQSTAS